MFTTSLYFGLLIPLLMESAFAKCPNGWIMSTISSNKCYLIVTQKTQWFSADAACRNAFPGAHLTSVCSAFENAFIDSLVTNAFQSAGLPGNGYYWLGLNDIDTLGSFQWINGDVCPFRRWATGQPTVNAGRLCVAAPATTGQWATENCATACSFVCSLDTASLSTTGTDGTSLNSFSPTAWTGSTASPCTLITPPYFTHDFYMRDCWEWRHMAAATCDGIYTVKPDNTAPPFQVYCDMTTDGGGWTVFQRRLDNSTMFWKRLWSDYKMGFPGNLQSNFWLGLDKIHALTSPNTTLRIELRGNRCLPHGTHINCGPNFAYFGEWSSFLLESEANGYRLQISPLTPGNLSTLAFDPLIWFNNQQPFITSDNDQSNICASFQIGPWWQGHCGSCFLNGNYNPYDDDTTSTKPAYGFAWYNGVESIDPIASEMKLRPQG